MLLLALSLSLNFVGLCLYFLHWLWCLPCNRANTENLCRLPICSLIDELVTQPQGCSKLSPSKGENTHMAWMKHEAFKGPTTPCSDPCRSCHHPFPWWIFHDLHHCSRELTALFSQLYTQVISAVVSKNQSAANTDLGSKVKWEQTINWKIWYCNSLISPAVCSTSD